MISQPVYKIGFIVCVLHNAACYVLLSLQALTLNFCIHWPGVPVDLKKMSGPPKKLLARIL